MTAPQTTRTGQPPAARVMEVGPSGGSGSTSAGAVAVGGAAPATGRVVGLDLSLSATGIAFAGDPITVKGIDSGIQRLRFIRAAAAVATVGADLIVLEGPSYNSKDGYAHERAGLWWMVFDELTAANIPVAVVPPASLKKYATGKGNATKPDMRMALFQRAGLDLRDDNQVDAWWLRAMGLDHLGQPPVAMPATHRAALDKVTWPEGIG